MTGQLKAVLAAAEVVRSAARSFDSSIKEFGQALADNEAFVLDLDQKADRKRALDADIERLNGERSVAEGKTEAAKKALADIRKNIG